MRTLFAISWLSPSGRNLLISLVSSFLVVVGAFALLKINSGGKRVPQEIVTGSVKRSPEVRRSASNDPMAAFLVTPSVAPSTQATEQMAVGVSLPIPLPRSRPKRP
jgi:hypothetical protein